jgi:hypothetical protein
MVENMIDECMIDKPTVYVVFSVVNQKFVANASRCRASGPYSAHVIVPLCVSLLND